MPVGAIGKEEEWRKTRGKEKKIEYMREMETEM